MRSFEEEISDSIRDYVDSALIRYGKNIRLGKTPDFALEMALVPLRAAEWSLQEAQRQVKGRIEAIHSN